MPKQAQQRIQLRHISVDFHNHRLWRGQEQQDIDGQTLRVLKVLIDHYPHTVAREQLLEEAWPNLVVSDNSLSQCITHLRRLWGDNPREPSFIRTVPRRGYQLLVKPEISFSAGTRRYPWFLIGLLALLVLIAGIAGLVVTTLPDPDERTGEIVAQAGAPFVPTYYVTTQPGIESFPRFSPDGFKLAYAQASPEGDYDVLVTQLDSAKHRVLLQGPGDAYPGDWSPDGKQLLVVRQHEGDCELVVIAVALPEPSEYTLLGCEYSDFPARLRWVSDERIYMAHGVGGRPRLTRLTLARQGDSEKYQVIEADTLAGVYPEDLDSSPDGGRYLLLSERLDDRAQYRLSRYDTLEGSIEELDTQQSPYWGISWFGNASRYLMGGRLRAGQGHGRTQELYPNTSLILDVDYHSSGKIAISEARAQINLARLDPNTGLVEDPDSLARLAPSSQVDFLPALSADGDRLAFISSRHNPSQLGLWQMAYPGGEPELLKKLDADILPQRLRWSANGRYLMLADNRHRLYCYDTQKAHRQQLTAPGEQGFYPFWVENAVYFNVMANEQIQLVAMDACGDKRRVVTTLEKFVLHRFKDGRLLLGVPNTGEVWLQQAQAEPSVIARVTSLETLYANEQGLYYIHREDKDSRLMFQDYRQSAARPLFEAITANYGNVSRQFSVHEKTGNIVVPVPGEHQADIIVLEPVNY